MAQLLSNLPVGAKVKFGKYQVNTETPSDITWLVVAKNHYGGTNEVTLFSEKIVDIACFDAKEPSNNLENLAEYGNNRYSYSNLNAWLNSRNGANEWYSPKHTNDAQPSVENVYDGVNPYSSRPGFLYNFSPSEYASIKTTTVQTLLSREDGGTYESVATKVFLPSLIELNLLDADGKKLTQDGTAWGYPTDITLLRGEISDALKNNARIAIDDSFATYYWSRNGYYTGFHIQCVYSKISSFSTQATLRVAADSKMGVRPVLNLISSTKVSDTTDVNGYYTFVWNTAPTQPATLNVPTIYGGKSNSISWSSANDPDGDALTYQLECSINGGEYTQIYSGASTSYAHLVPFGTTSVAYRVKATDTSNESSAYTNSLTIAVVNNNAPVISGADANLGVRSSGFTGTYTITDANSDTVTVTEAIDGVQIRSLVATLGEEITYGVTENTWLALPNGSHTLTLRATDGIDTSVRTYTFTKLVETLKIQNATPWVSATMPSRIMLVVTRNIPSTATFKVEVCNNGYDASPAWEDCTDAVKSGLVHVFENTKKTASNWGVLVRVKVARNGATGACYISAIGGNFE